MADVKISDLTADTGPLGTAFVETETTGGASRKVLLSNLHKALTAATETVPGVVELATVAECETGTDTARACTPAGVAAAIVGRR